MTWWVLIKRDYRCHGNNESGEMAGGDEPRELPRPRGKSGVGSADGNSLQIPAN